MGQKIEVRIEQILEERGRSLYWLSRTTGISYTTLWRLTKERALGVNFATLEKLCEALDCLPGDLMDLANVKKEKAPGKLARAASSRL